jgi:hypothetical protein
MRITETTAKWIHNAVMPQRYMDEARKGFWEAMIHGKRRRDPFGTLYGTHLARNLAIVGGTSMLASAYTGISPIKLASIAMAHLPWMHESTHGWEMSTPAIMDAPKTIQELGGLSAKSLRYAFLDHYTLYAPAKLMRMIEGNIPKLYRGGQLPPEFYYLVGEPPEKTLRQMQSEHQQKSARYTQKRYDALDKKERYNIIVRFHKWLKDLASSQ